ncbi:thioredoxin fold domain-containing protein [Vibrio sonorensis]|uniref:thioredoxin fold domain-containing protein n=1 Tax=Vibrio sonorensis TaxID=1004316 RepID=UPI0008D9F3E5|nr:thioredoxin fold domain-containing protein [Vibrio sonorensis]
MSVLRLITLFTLPFLLAACNAENANAESKVNPESAVSKTVQADVDLIKEKFAKMGINVQEVTASDVDGIYEITTDGGILFATHNADFFFAGTLYSLDNKGKYTDVLAQRRQPENAAKIAELSDSAIEYKAENEKHVITVFTDITCGYCVELHKHMKEYNDLGITVRYLAFPRYGLEHDTADQMAAIWCSDDPAAGMHDTKIKRKLPASTGDLAQCKATITKHYNLAKYLGVKGTPAIFLESGEMVGGYLDPQAMQSRLTSTK